VRAPCATPFGEGRLWLLWVVTPIVVLASMLACAPPASADRSFSTRFNADTNGNVTIAANTLMVCPAAASGCTAARSTPPIASGTNNAINNNSYNMQYVNTAPGTVAGTPSFDSSTAMLSLPATATVLFAGLYWGADTSAGASVSAGPTPAVAPNAGLRNQVGLEVPGATAYASVTASQLDVSSGSATRYNAFANVTAQVQAAGSGTYAVANVQAGTGGDRYAGWALVVAYQDPTQPARDLTVDDGFVTVSSGSPPITIPVSGFRTPPSGAVQTTLGFVGYEGDSGLTGDSASLNGTTLSDGANPAGNFWCSAISNFGTNVTTRNPNDINNFAFDAKLVSGNGILKNNGTSANIVVTTSGDTYFPAVVTLATQLYAPQITSTKTVRNLTHPGGPDQLGDTLQYTVSYTNTGSDSAANFVMRDSIPAGTTYVPGTLHIGGSAGSSNPTDALADDAGEFNATTGEVVFRLGVGGNGTTGGQIRPGDTDTATFNVTINANDSPGQQIVNQATATFTGLTLGTAFTDTSPTVTDTVSAPSLTLAKSHIGSLVAGQATTFALAVSNVGNLATSGTVTVTDPFPTSSFSTIANANGSGWSCSIAGLTLTCTRSDALAAGNSYPPIFVDATVADPAPATVSNTATVSGGGSAPATGSDGGGGSGLADVSITKSVDSSIVPSGGTVTYTLNVQNTGPSSAQNVTVSDPVDPASFSDVSAQPSQGSCDTTVSCSLGSLPANGSATITVTATVIARDTTLTNTASVSSSTPDPNAANNSASATITVPASADLAITKTGTANPDQGSADSYTLTITNNGPDSAHGVVVNDTVPSQFTATSASGPGFTCTVPTGAGGTVVCTDPLLTTAQSPVQITINGTVAGGTAGQTMADAATVTSDSADPDLTNNTASLSQLIGPAAYLVMSKSALLSVGGAPVNNPLAVGNTFVYALGVTNNGPSDAANVMVTDPLPAGITPTPGTLPAGCTFAPSGSSGTVTCALGTVTAGTTATINLNVTIGVAANNTAPTNTATLSTTTVDPDTTDTSASATIGVGSVANLGITKSVSPQTANVGQLVTYTLTGTNDISIGESGGTPTGLGTTGAVITDPLPPGIQFVSSTTCTAAGGVVTCHLGPLAQAQVATATFTTLVTSAAAGQSVTNTATISSEAAGGFPALPDFNPADSMDSATLNVNPEADLSLTKTASNANPAVDDEVDYTLTASNAGPNDATGVTITDPLPPGLDFIDATPGCDNVMGTVRCDLGTVPSGGSASVTVRTHTSAALAGTAVTNLATVSSDDLDPNPNNNQASATIDVQALVDLELTKVASNPAPHAGGQVSYTLSLVNNGPSPATGITITDPLPSGLTFVSATSGQGSCGAGGQTVVCNLGTLAPGGTALASITAAVASSTAGTTVQNTATASANEPIAQPELLRAQALIRPVPEAPPARAALNIEKTVNHKVAQYGSELKYTITVSNAGPATAVTPTVTDAFSADASIVSIHPSSGSCNRRRPVTCKLGSIAPGGRATITIVARGEALGKLRNTASVSTPTPVASGSHTLATATTTIVPGPHSRIALSDTTSTPTIPAGGTATFMLRISNPNPWPVQNVKVCDTLPAGVIFAAGSLGVRHTGRVVCWTIKTLRPHASNSMWVSFEPQLGVTGTLRDAATATAAAGDRRLSARAHAQVTVAPSTVCGSAGDLPNARGGDRGGGGDRDGGRGPVARAAC
jgi:large repetitive protein